MHLNCSRSDLKPISKASSGVFEKRIMKNWWGRGRWKSVILLKQCYTELWNKRQQNSY